MREILIISDTHDCIPVDLSTFECTTLFHAGDIGFSSILNELYVIDSVYAVMGNTDMYSDITFPETLTKTLGNLKFFMVHNLSAPHRIIKENRTIIDQFAPDVVIFGHTHMPFIARQDGILYVNPGSLGKNGLTGIMSYAIMKVTENEVCEVNIFEVHSGETVISWKK